MKTRLWNRNFTLLTLSNFLMCCAYYSLISTLPLYISTVPNANHSIVGLVLASYAIAAILVSPFCGFPLDYFGRKAIFIAALLVYGFIFNVCILVTTVWFMIGVRFAHGLTWGYNAMFFSAFGISMISMIMAALMHGLSEPTASVISCLSYSNGG